MYTPRETETSRQLGSAMQRADRLLRQMTLEEKAMQLSCVWRLALLDAGGTNQSQLARLLEPEERAFLSVATVGESPATVH